MARGGKWLTGVLLGLIALSQWQLWSDKRVFHVRELYRSNLISQIENDTLSARNSRLEREIKNMKSGFETIEREAREELGMIKKGETFFRLTGHAARQDLLGQ